MEKLLLPYRFLVALWVLLCLSLPMWVPAQGTEAHVERPEGRYHYHYFVGSKKVSTEVFWAAEGEKGHAVAYDRAGKEVYREGISRMHMIRSVDFSYHDDGSVAKAVMSWHPDAGLHFGHTTTFFSPDGAVTGVEEWSTEDKVMVTMKDVDPTPQQDPPVVPPAPAQEVVVEAPIYATTYYFVNKTRRPLQVSVLNNQGQPFSGDQRQGRMQVRETVAPGDTLYGRQLLMMGVHGNACDDFRVELGAKKAKWLEGVGVDCGLGVVVDVGKTVREVYFPIAAKER